MPQPGDVVTVDFPGAMGTKRRPCVVVSSDEYHAHRPDVILAVLTTNINAATTPTDYILQDWKDAGLNKPSAVRIYVSTQLNSDVRVTGHLTDRDWVEVQARLRIAIAVS